MEKFRRGAYRLGLQKKVTLRDGEAIALWSFADALMIKVLTRIVQAKLQPALNRACYHLKCHSGLKGGGPGGDQNSAPLQVFLQSGLDRRLESLEVKYFRYMDDILILAATR